MSHSLARGRLRKNPYYFQYSYKCHRKPTVVDFSPPKNSLAAPIPSIPEQGKEQSCRTDLCCFDLVLDQPPIDRPSSYIAQNHSNLTIRTFPKKKKKKNLKNFT